MSRWYRAYEGTVTDGKLAEAAMIAEVSRALSVAAWHALLEGAASKNNCGSHGMTGRRIAIIFGEPVDRVEALLAAFDEIGLTADGAIAAWQKRQFQEGKTDGTKSNGERYVYVAGTAWERTVKLGFSKNPWARAKELQTGNAAKVEILAHFRCAANSEVELHDALSEYRHAGEWFNLPSNICAAFQQAVADTLTYEELVAKLRIVLRSATSPVKAETETDSEKEEESPSGDSSSGDERALDIKEVFEGFQSLMSDLGLPVPRDLTPERRQLLRFRIKQYPLADFQTVFAKCRDSPFLRGDKGRTPLKFDWLFKKANFQKVLEGNYD